MAEIKKFEEALQELEEIVRQLEGDMPLDQAVKAFEKGIELSKICISDHLAKARSECITNSVYCRCTYWNKFTYRSICIS